MASGKPILVKHRDNRSNAAVIFIHGFGGDSTETWGQFPKLLIKNRAVEHWDVYSLGYASKLRFDLIGIWEADPDIPKLARYLRTACEVAPLDRYKCLALVAHSMGGLVVQLALVDFDDLAQRVGHVILFGTPSAGLRKASLFRWLKRQVRDMSHKGPLITRLRQKWVEKFGRQSGRIVPFTLWSVAGDRDEFVPSESSLDAFPAADFPEAKCAVVSGNHLEIVKPRTAGSTSVKLVVKMLQGKAAAAGPWNGAAVAVESRDFQRAIDLLEPHKDELDADALVQLALALEGCGRGTDALAILESRHPTTDAMGVLAGRLKRRWMVERREEDARRARKLYVDAFKLSIAAKDHEQAFYHGINVAFMDLAYAPNRTEAKKRAAAMARKVLTHCGKVGPRKWRYATEGEAQLMLGETDSAMVGYEAFLREGPTPREIESTYQQAKKVADLMANRNAAERLDVLFRGSEE